MTATPSVCQARQGTKPINRKNQKQEIIEWGQRDPAKDRPHVCKRTIILWLPRNHRYKYKWMNRKIKQGGGRKPWLPLPKQMPSMRGASLTRLTPTNRHSGFGKREFRRILSSHVGEGRQNRPLPTSPNYHDG